MSNYRVHPLPHNLLFILFYCLTGPSNKNSINRSIQFPYCTTSSNKFQRLIFRMLCILRGIHIIIWNLFQFVTIYIECWEMCKAIFRRLILAGFRVEYKFYLPLLTRSLTCSLVLMRLGMNKVGESAHL